MAIFSSNKQAPEPASPAPAAEAPPPGGECDRLLERRDALHDELKRLGRIDEAHWEVERRLAELDAEAGRVDEAEREAWLDWAEGPPPAARVAEREDVASRRALLAVDLTATVRGQEGVRPRLEQIHGKLRDLGLSDRGNADCGGPVRFARRPAVQANYCAISATGTLDVESFQ